MKTASGQGPRTVLIGLGRIAFQLERDRLRYHPCTHAGSLRAFNQSLSPKSRARRPFDLVGVCDTDPAQIEAFRRWWGGRDLTATRNHRDILQLQPDLVIIATSVESHAPIARAAIQNGARGVLLEKPIGYNSAQARSLLRVAEKKAARVWVNFERRYHPAYRLARRYVLEKKFGELRHISGRVLTGAMRPDPHKTVSYIEGPLLHDAVHWIDLLLWIAGKPRRFDVSIDPSPRPDRPGIEDTARLRFDYDDFSAYLESGGRRRYFEFNMELDFSEGRIVAGNAGHFYYRAGASKRYSKFRELCEVPTNWKPANPWLELYDEINRELTRYPDISPGEYPAARERITAGLADAAAGMEIIDRCYRRLKT